MNGSTTVVWTTKLFSCICDITKIIPPTEIRLVGGWGEHLVEHCTFQNLTMGGTLGSGPPPGQHAYNVLPYTPNTHNVYRASRCKCEIVKCLIKQRLWAEFGFVYSVTGETSLSLYHSNSCSCWQIINLHIYAEILHYITCSPLLWIGAVMKI